MSELQEQVLSWIRADEDKLIGFCRDFVRARSPNPPGDTREAMEIVTRFLDREGLAYTSCTAKEHLPNIVASFEGARPGRHLLFNGHADVFPIGNADLWQRDPWGGDHADGRIHGRGAADMKAGTTAALFAYGYLARLKEKLAGKLTLMVVSDEETGGRWGSQHLIDTLGETVLGDCLLSGEPGGVGTIRFAEKGILQFIIDIRTRGAHGPYAHLSPSAIRIAGEIMSELDAVKGFKASLPETVARRLTGDRARAVIEETMGEGTADVMTRVSMNIGTIQGGSKINMVPSDCTMEVDIRVPVGVDRDVVIARVRAIVDAHPGASIRDMVGGPPNFSDPEHEMVELLASYVVGQGYPEPIRIPMLAASDCRLWREKGVPAFVYGTSPRNVSAPNESVLVSEFLHVVRVHTLAALDYLTPH
jgi:succinyl-diaminopimelate desuccinylase